MENSMTIKRGMVFYLDEPYKNQPIDTDIANIDNYPKKKRPYIVVSNDKCNENSNLIHVAPIFSITNTLIPKWWKIPFKGPCNKDSYVNISYIMLVSSNILNDTSYSEAITQYTVHNKNLFEAIDKAICKQFGIGTDVINTAVYDTMTRYPVNNQPIPVVPNITLNISVNGIPVSENAVSVESSSIQTNNNIDTVSNDTCVAVSTVADNQLVIGEPELEKNENISKNDTSKKSDAYTKKFRTKQGRRLSIQQKKKLQKFIIDNHKDFNGNMTTYRISKLFGITINTVQKYASEIERKKDSDKNTKEQKNTGKHRASLPKELNSEFLDYYMNHTMDETLKKYEKYGFTKSTHVKDKVYNIRKKMKSYGIKTGKGSVRERVEKK